MDIKTAKKIIISDDNYSDELLNEAIETIKKQQQAERGQGRVELPVSQQVSPAASDELKEFIDAAIIDRDYFMEKLKLAEAGLKLIAFDNCEPYTPKQIAKSILRIEPLPEVRR